MEKYGKSESLTQHPSVSLFFYAFKELISSFYYTFVSRYILSFLLFLAFAYV